MSIARLKLMASAAGTIGGITWHHLYLIAADSSVSYLSDSRSFGATSARPLLTITAVPEPQAVLICLLGTSCFFAARRRCSLQRR